MNLTCNAMNAIEIDNSKVLPPIKNRRIATFNMLFFSFYLFSFIIIMIIIYFYFYTAYILLTLTISRNHF